MQEVLEYLSEFVHRQERFCILTDRDLSDSVRIVCTSSVMVLHVLVVCML